MAKHDGGPAFPSVDAKRKHWPGMTRRQLYAGMAMMGELAHLTIADVTDEELGRATLLYWRIADALLVTEEEE